MSVKINTIQQHKSLQGLRHFGFIKMQGNTKTMMQYNLIIICKFDLKLICFTEFEMQCLAKWRKFGKCKEHEQVGTKEWWSWNATCLCTALASLRLVLETFVNYTNLLWYFRDINKNRQNAAVSVYAPDCDGSSSIEQRFSSVVEWRIRRMERYGRYGMGRCGMGRQRMVRRLLLRKILSAANTLKGKLFCFH